MNNESERQNQIDKIERFNLWKFEETKNNQIIFPIFSNNNKKKNNVRDKLPVRWIYVRRTILLLLLLLLL